MTDAQTEARAIAQKLQDVVDGTDGWLNIDKATDIIATALEAQAAELAEVKSKCQALDDECQQSMLDISRERDRAERASALLAEWIEQWAVVKDQLAEARKALEAIIERSHNDPLGTSKVIDMREIARRALEAQGGENGR